MSRGVSRGGLLLAAGLVAACCLSGLVRAQGFRPPGPVGPRPPIGPQPPAGINGGMPGAGVVGGMPGAGAVGGMPGAGVAGGIAGGGILGGGPLFEFKCSKCGRVVGQGNSTFDGPANCPFCGTRFINGGLGRGTGLGNAGMPPLANPGMPPGGAVPPPPAITPPPEVPDPIAVSPTSVAKSSSGRTIALIVGGVVLGLLVLVGFVLVIVFSLQGSRSSGR